MGYYSTVRGAITIHPPLTWDEYEGSPFQYGHRDYRDYRDVQLCMEFVIGEKEPDRHSAGGPGISATQLQGHEDSYKCYDMERHLREFVAAFGDGHTFQGYLIRSGEEQGDLERYTIDNNDGSVITEKARLVWSDGPIENIEDVDREDYEL